MTKLESEELLCAIKLKGLEGNKDTESRHCDVDKEILEFFDRAGLKILFKAYHRHIKELGFWYS